MLQERLNSPEFPDKLFIRRYGNGQINTSFFGSHLITITAHSARVVFSSSYESFQVRGISPQNPGSQTLSDLLGALIPPKIYIFRAERMNIGRGVYGHDTVLSSDARNLPAVLGGLQANPIRYQRYVRAVSTVFPEIRQITVNSDPSGGEHGIQINVWTVDPSTERLDLAVPLTESGTGISQVLAILYVVLNADEPQTLLIDEPQSFLHPGAARKLITLLRQHPQHQYVLATHSATVIAAADPDRVILLRKTENASTAHMIEASETAGLSLLLSEVGARLSDVFGADNILWVEGPTEERALPLILDRLLPEPLYGTQILGVSHTGDFDGRHAALVIDIYRKLSTGPSLLPPSLGFIFDREDRTQAQRDDFQRQTGGAVVFTTRRMFENYLLEPRSIATAASSIPDFAPEPITTEQVEQWLDLHRWDRKYFGRVIPTAERSEEFWLREVNAAKLLQDVFAELSENRVVYDKVRDSVALTKLILNSNPEVLQEFVEAAEYIRDLRKRAQGPSASD